MEKPEVLTNDKKLVLIHRVEPGCLGPDGVNYIEEFCQFANKNLRASRGAYIYWKLVPRYDKSLPEMEYSFMQHIINEEQAQRFLMKFDQHLEDYIGDLDVQITDLIERFFALSH